MEKIRVAIIGYGNIGKYSLEAVLAAPDMELAGVVRRDARKPQPQELSNVAVAEDIAELENVDVAILSTPTRSIQEYAEKYLAMGINTVDSYDIHDSIWELRGKLQKAAQAGNSTAIIAAGWDPGSDSIVRALMEACAPKGITYTNFGPGMSMGHSVAVKAIEGVEDALSMTIPLGTGIHRRLVYVQLKKGADMKRIEKDIRNDPYFVNDEVHIKEVKDVDLLIDRGHGVNMVRKAVSGVTQNQRFEFNMQIDNPALTAQVLVAAARATFKQKPGAYTLIEIPVIDLLAGDKEELIRHLV